jgi:hypothetical protein
MTTLFIILTSTIKVLTFFRIILSLIKPNLIDIEFIIKKIKSILKYLK